MHSEALWLWMVVYIILMIHQPQHFLLVFIDVLVLPLHRGPPFPGGNPGGRFANKAANKANPGQLWDSSSFSFSDLCLLLSHTSPMTSFLVLPVYSHYLIFIELLNLLFFFFFFYPEQVLLAESDSQCSLLIWRVLTPWNYVWIGKYYYGSKSPLQFRLGILWQQRCYITSTGKCDSRMCPHLMSCPLKSVFIKWSTRSTF